MDWAATLRKESLRSSILRSDELARRYDIAEAVVGNALRRQERRGLVEHISRRVYVNKLAHDFSARELVSVLRPNAYISLESALAEWGISTQSPSGLTCVTTGFPRKFQSASVNIIYRHISESLYWGFEEKRTRYGTYKIAEPEKALLDWVYLQRQEGLPVALDELSLNAIDRKKLRKYAAKYPNSVQQTLRDVPYAFCRRLSALVGRTQRAKQRRTAHDGAWNTKPAEAGKTAFFHGPPLLILRKLLKTQAHLKILPCRLARQISLKNDAFRGSTRLPNQLADPI